ncbi:DUF883 family protein [Variovorax sp. YR216]|uniref:DUF883 family protein n=1 Tax=Variovorax sp. YR216 TaxID=1882828 RepID=UPI00089BB0C0|nr:DUF883 family protein [Variovorax sp. YR216]SEB24365.1 protein of unknown function [Variovorax sp. YR216]
MNHETIRKADASATCAKNRWSHVLGDLGDRLGDLRRTNVATRARDAMRTADDGMHQHPYTAMAAMAFAGLIAGILIARR